MAKTQQFSPITVNMNLKGAVDGILNNYGKAVVQLQQTVTTTTTYPEREGNSRSSGLGNLGAKIGGAVYAGQPSTRTTLFAIGNGVTAQQIMDELAKHPNARLYQVLSTDVVTTREQDYQISKGNLKKDDLAKNQVVREKGTLKLVVNESGELLYKACFLDVDGREDEDETLASHSYMPDFLVQELAGTTPAQHSAPSVPVAAGSAAEALSEATREGAPAAENVEII